MCTDFLKILGSNGNIAEWRRWPKISDHRIVYVPDSVLSSFWVQSKTEVGNSVACTLRRYKPHWRKAENAFGHYRWGVNGLKAKKSEDIPPETLLLALSVEQPVHPPMSQLLSQCLLWPTWCPEHWPRAMAEEGWDPSHLPLAASELGFLWCLSDGTP